MNFHSQTLTSFWATLLLGVCFSSPLIGQIDTSLLVTRGSATTIRFSSTCSANGTCVQLTDQTPNQRGAVWYKNPLVINDGFEFVLCASFGDNDAGGTGLAIILQDSPAGTEAIGVGGSGMGYAGIPQSLGILIDTHYDPTTGDLLDIDNITLVADGRVDNYLVEPINSAARHCPNVQYQTDINIEDGSYHSIGITWDPFNQYLQVFFNGRLRLSHQINLIDDYFPSGQAFVGASAATGSIGNVHRICMESEPFDFETQPEGCVSSDPEINFNYWYQTGDPNAACWSIHSSNQAVIQERNNEVTFYISPYELINTEMQLTMEVTEEVDDDFIGFAFGYQSPFGGDPDQYDTWLFDWKKVSDTIIPGRPCHYPAKEGFTLSKLQGKIIKGCDPEEGLYHFWGHQPGPNFRVVDSSWEAGLGWDYQVEYDFKLRYTDTEILIQLKRGQTWDTIFQHRASAGECFQPGRFGCYTYSQSGVRFSQFRYHSIGDFQLSAETICLGDSVQVSIDTPCSTQRDSQFCRTHYWDFGDNSPNSQTEGDKVEQGLSHLYLRSDTFTIQLAVEDHLGCISPPFSRRVVVQPLPELELGPDRIHCAGDTSLFLLPQGSIHYEWSTGDTSATVSFDRAGAYWVRAALGACTRTDSVTISFHTPLRLADLLTTATCFGQSTGSFEILPQGSLPPYRYWLDDLPEEGPRFTALPKNNYEIKVIDSAQCQWDTVLALPEYPPVAYELRVEPISCWSYDDGRAQIISNREDLWYRFEAGSFSSQSHYDNLTSGDYQIQLQDSFGCIYDSSFTILEPGPLELVLPDTLHLLLGDTLQLVPEHNAIQDLVYRWSTAPFISCTDCPYPQVYPHSSQTYELTISSAKGCTDQASVVVHVDEDRSVYLPNAFSPNDDGHNDYFTVYSGRSQRKIEQIEYLQVYNRWGALLFERRNFPSDQEALGWDGRFRGQALPSGVYLYRVAIRYIDGQRRERSGDLTLLY
ncbi:MAG: gliding motility-associated C-terminal domain-containing protein [Bacteroidota bacterium]